MTTRKNSTLRHAALAMAAVAAFGLAEAQANTFTGSNDGASAQGTGHSTAPSETSPGPSYPGPVAVKPTFEPSGGHSLPIAHPSTGAVEGDAPDSSCEGDLNGDGVVDFGDMIEHLSASSNEAVSASKSGQSSFDRLLSILSNWGSCPR